ncbi:MAG TPA: hypothetical protein VN380_15035 [Thermoanaerobaculia bacterium]|jgi:hypothetical protein|nr:hypothetical protein [Thermoanaerobaculia bacterium]
MSERSSRFEDLRLTPTQVAALLEVPEDRLARWVAGELETQDADVIEVGISLLEGVHRKPWRGDDFQAVMLAGVDALIG